MTGLTIRKNTATRPRGRTLALLATVTALAAFAVPARAADYDVSGATEVTAEVSAVTLTEAREATNSKSVVEREHGYGVIERLTGRDERPQGHAEALRQHFGALKGILAEAIAKGTLEAALSAAQQAAFLGWEEISSKGMDRMRKAIESAIEHGVPTRDAATVLSAMKQAEQMGLPVPEDSKLRQQYDGVVAGWDDAGDDPPDGDGGGGFADDPPPDRSDPPDDPTGGGGGGGDGDDWTLVHTSSGSSDGHSFHTDTYKNEDGVFKDVTTSTDPDGTDTTTTTCYTTEGTQGCPEGRPSEDSVPCPVCDWALSLLGGDPYVRDADPCAEEACPEVLPGAGGVDPDVDGDGRPDVEEPGVIDPSPDADAIELDPDAWIPCETACPEGDPRDPPIDDQGPPVDPRDPSPITLDP